MHTSGPSNEDAPPARCSVSKDKPHGTVECVAQEIPEFLLSELLLLFPGVSGQVVDRLHVITLSQHTQHDMTGWSMEVEQEREQLLEHVSPFITPFPLREHSEPL